MKINNLNELVEVLNQRAEVLKGVRYASKNLKEVDKTGKPIKEFHEIVKYFWDEVSKDLELPSYLKHRTFSVEARDDSFGYPVCINERVIYYSKDWKEDKRYNSYISSRGSINSVPFRIIDTMKEYADLPFDELLKQLARDHVEGLIEHNKDEVERLAKRIKEHEQAVVEFTDVLNSLK